MSTCCGHTGGARGEHLTCHGARPAPGPASWGSRVPSGRWSCPGSRSWCLHTSRRLWAELPQRSVAPKQKQRVQPFGLAASKEKVPRRHWSHLGPCTFSWGQNRADQPVMRYGVQHPGSLFPLAEGVTPPVPPGGVSAATQEVGVRPRSPARRPAPHLAVALACDGVAHAGHGARFMAVTGETAGVAVEARSTGITAAPGHVGSAPARGSADAGQASPPRLLRPRVAPEAVAPQGVTLPLPRRGESTLSGTAIPDPGPTPAHGDSPTAPLTCTGHCPRHRWGP